MIGLTEDYLDTVHSIRDMVLDIDRSIANGMPSETIWAQEWFRLQLDLRNVFHHKESPLCSVESGNIQYTFRRLPDAPKFFSLSDKDAAGNYAVDLEVGDLSKELITALNEWAKKHLGRLPDETVHRVITKVERDGRLKSKKITLGEIRKHLT